MNYVTVGAVKVSSGGLKACCAHIERLVETPNADREKTHLNHVIGKDDGLAQEVVEKIIADAGITPRKNAVLVVELVVSASPAFFQDEKKQLDPERVKIFADATEKFFADHKKLGKFAKGVMHLDEMTPHAHGLFVPITDDGKLCCKQLLSTYKHYRELHDDAGRAFFTTGLWRGAPNNRSKHQKVRDFYKIIDKEINFALDYKRLPAPPRILVTTDAQEKYKRAVAAAVVEQVRDDVRVLEHRAKMHDNEKARRRASEQRTDDFERAYLNERLTWKKNKTALQDENDRLCAVVRERESEIVELENERDGQKQTNDKLAKKLAQSQNRLRDIPIDDIISMKELKFKKDGEKTLYYSGSKLVFIEVNGKVFSADQKTEIQCAVQAYAEVRHAEARSNQQKNLSVSQIVKELSEEFGAKRALAAGTHYSRTVYQQELRRAQEIAKEKPQAIERTHETGTQRVQTQNRDNQARGRSR